MKVKTRARQVLTTLTLCAALWTFRVQAQVITISDINGKIQTLFAPTNKTVLIFYWHDCPICNSYAPAINRLAQIYTNFSFYIVQVDSDLTQDAARHHAQQYLLTAPVLLDPHHRLVKLAGATITPEAVVFGQNQSVLYRGRLDNLYASLNQRRTQATDHTLADVLTTITNGRPVTNQPATIGCFIQ